MIIKKYLQEKLIYKNSSVILFLCCFLFLLLWIPFGIDLTDEGKQMSISWFLFSKESYHDYNLYKIGSWFINGLWLRVIGTPLLIWERIGGALIMSLCALFAYKIMKLYSNSGYTIFIIFVTFFFIICENHPETKIDHNNLPTLLAIISIYLMSLYLIKDSNSNSSYYYNILSSLVMIISIFTRFPHIIFLFLPLLYFVISFKVNKFNKNKFIIAILTYYLPIMILFIIFLMVIFLKGSLIREYILEVFKNFYGEIHSMLDFNKLNKEVILDNTKLKEVSYLLVLLKRYLKDFVYIIILTIIFLIGFLLGKNILNYYNKSRFYSDKLEKIFYIIIGIFLFISMQIKPWMWYMASFGFFSAYLIMIIIKKSEVKRELFFLFWGISLIIISFLGSISSIRHSVPAGAVFILVPIIALMNKEKKEILENLNLHFLYKFTVIFFIILLFVSGYKKIFNDNKRDVQPIFARNTMFKSPELFGIFSSKDKVEAIDGIMNISKEYIKKEDTLICFNSVPMLHYLLNRDYFLSDPWIEQIKLDKELEEKAIKNVFPDYIIFSKRSAREKDWPNTEILYELGDKEKYQYMIDYIDKYDYKNIYENNGFILYKK